MSLSPFFYIEKWSNKTKKYERLHLYGKADEYHKGEKYQDIDFWPYNGTHDVFSLLGTASRADEYETIDGIGYGNPGNLSEEVQKIIESFDDDSIVRYITLADLKIEIMTHPKVLDWDSNWGEDEKCKYKENPLIDFFNRVKSFVDWAVENTWEEYTLSEIRIVYWVVW